MGLIANVSGVAAKLVVVRERDVMGTLRDLLVDKHELQTGAAVVVDMVIDVTRVASTLTPGRRMDSISVPSLMLLVSRVVTVGEVVTSEWAAVATSHHLTFAAILEEK